MKKKKETNKHIRTKPAARLEISITPLSEGSQGRRGEGSQAESCGKNPRGSRSHPQERHVMAELEQE